MSTLVNVLVSVIMFVRNPIAYFKEDTRPQQRPTVDELRELEEYEQEFYYRR